MSLSNVMDGGRIQGTLMVSDGQVVVARMESSRILNATTALEGKPLTVALPWISMLFSICGTAQTVAGTRAAEMSLGMAPDPAHEAARDLLVATEMAVDGTARALLEWPRLVGKPPQGGPLPRLRQALDKIPKLVYPTADYWRPGGGTLEPDLRALTGILNQYQNFLARDVFDVPVDQLSSVEDMDGFSDWMGRADTPIAQFLRYLADQGLAEFGWIDIPLLGEMDADWITEQLAEDEDGHFRREPERDGKTQETGPLEAHAAHPVVRGFQVQHGICLISRFVARIVELLELGHQMRRLADSLVPLSSRRQPSRDGGGGVGFSRTTRGRLAHWMHVSPTPKGPMVRRYRILAPTEWNFQNRGPFARGVVRADAHDRESLLERVALLKASLDPCVACDITVEELV